MCWFWFNSMFRYLNILVLVIAAVFLQTIIFPAYLAEPFRPGILLIFTVYLGFRAGIRAGACSSFLLGLLQDALSGIYFGLNGFSFLLVFLLYHEASERLYTGSRTLMVLGALLATVLTAFVHLLLLLIFSASEGVYASILGALLPQCMVNALVSGLIFRLIPLAAAEEGT